ncbi:MAG: hypothetical protein J6B36_05590 [Muribaculaceae bacterium]|nr:hypothetical protein [Muribaculaceae bacterium]
MNKRQARLSQIVNILLHNQVGSQEELMDELKARNCEVTQATLSRDLKTLRTSKVVTEMGGYRYVIAANGTAADEVATHAMDSVRQAAILSLAFTGNIAVIKTRNGYAGGLAYDIDEISSPLLLGTIAGADTVFVALAEDASRNDLITLFSAILPANVIAESKQNFS